MEINTVKAAGFLLLGTASGVACAQQVVATADGKLAGSVAGTVASFKGIPFAAPPIGDLRWSPPAPVTPWSGTRDATNFGPQCTQVSFQGKTVSQQSEDCLTVSVWKPVAAKPGAKLPVMVWIYGGGFIVGGNSVTAYDGSHFAEHGVVLVSINYRLGKLGFFAHPALSAASGSQAVGNYGVMDAIAALKWVNTNISNFGGDPGNVTIFGQSAGGMMVNILMTSPAASGLFHKAISQSGAFRVPFRPLRGVGSAEAAGEEFAQANGIVGTDAASLKALRALPPEAIAGDRQKGTLGLGSASPMIDGQIVREAPFDAFVAAREARIPYIAGGTNGEASLNPNATPEAVAARMGDEAAAVKAAYSGDDLTIAKDVTTDSMLTEPVRQLVRLHAKHGEPSYAYSFSYVPEGQRPAVQRVPHGGELLYVFNNLTAQTFSFYDLVHPPATEKDRSVQKSVIGYWTNFAKTGSPGSVGGVSWPVITPGDVFMEFGPDRIQARPNYRKGQLDAVSRLAPMGPR